MIFLSANQRLSVNQSLVKINRGMNNLLLASLIQMIQFDFLRFTSSKIMSTISVCLSAFTKSPLTKDKCRSTSVMLRRLLFTDYNHRIRYHENCHNCHNQNFPRRAFTILTAVKGSRISCFSCSHPYVLNYFMLISGVSNSFLYMASGVFPKTCHGSPECQLATAIAFP